MSQHRSRAFPIAATLLWTLVACGDTKPAHDLSKAFDFPTASSQGKQTQERLKALAAKAETAAEDAKKAELEQITALPSALPELEAGCTDAGTAYDEYATRRTLPEHLERWNATKEPDILKVVTRCKDSGKPEVAACTSKALRDASLATFGPADGTLIVDHCVTRYGASDPPPA